MADSVLAKENLVQIMVGDLLDHSFEDKELGVQIISNYVAELTNHPQFEVWCFTSSIELLHADAQMGYLEVDAKIKILRTFFEAFAKGINKTDLTKALTDFNKRGVRFEDMNVSKEGCYVVLKVDNTMNSIYVYNSETTLGH